MRHYKVVVQLPEANISKNRLWGMINVAGQPNHYFKSGSDLTLWFYHRGANVATRTVNALTALAIPDMTAQLAERRFA